MAVRRGAYHLADDPTGETHYRACRNLHFLSVIALSGPVGPLAPLAIGAALMVMVYTGGHISGAHYNPAVSFGAFLRRKLGAADMVGYWVAQLVGAALAFAFGYLVSGHTPGIHPGPKVPVFQAVAVESANGQAVEGIALGRLGRSYSEHYQD